MAALISHFIASLVTLAENPVSPLASLDPYPNLAVHFPVGQEGMLKTADST